MRWWERQIGGPMRGRIIALLRRGASTVEELAPQLGSPTMRCGRISSFWSAKGS
jgi:hypothetical protein